MQRRKVSDSVPNLKSRGKKFPEGMKVGMPESFAPGNADPSDSSEGHDSGSGASKPANSHVFPK